MMPHRFLNRDAILIFFISLFIFTQGLSHQEIIGFESRFYLFALEMWRHGFSWFPTTYHEPYPDYPVTSTVLIYFTAKLFGTFNKAVAVLPSAIAASLTMSGTYLIGATQTRRVGWYSVGFLLFTLAFITEARTISLDMYGVAITTLAFYLAYAKKLVSESPPWLGISLLLIFSFAIRGPIGIVIPTGVLIVFYLLEKDWKSWFLLSILSGLLLIICTVILLCIAHHVGGKEFMQNVFNMEIAGRMEVNRTPSRYFYFIESFGAFAITYPLALLALFFIFKQKQFYKNYHFFILLIGWVLIIMLGLSIPADKKIRYILPIAPALALICGSFLMNLRASYNLSKKLEISFFLAVLIFIFTNIFIVEPINLHSNQTKQFVQTIEKMRHLQHAKLVFFREGRDGLAIKYLINMDQEEKPLFVENINEIPASRVFLIIREEDSEVIRGNKLFHLIGGGKIGHDRVVVSKYDE